MSEYIHYLIEKILDKKTLSVSDIAKKHSVSLDHINSQLKMGIAVEHEHTSDSKVASEIARDHIMEDPNYYTKLKKVEN